MDEDLMKEYLNNKSESEQKEINGQDDEASETANDAELSDGEGQKGKKRIKFNIFWIVFASLFVYVLALNRFPSVGNSLWFTIVIRLAIGMPFVVFAFWKIEIKTLHYRLFLIFEGLSWFTPFAFSGKVCLLIDLIILLYGIISFVLSYLGKYKTVKIRDTVTIALAFHFLLLFGDMRMYTFTDNSMKFWLPGVIGAVLIAAVIAVLVYTGKLKLKHGTGAEKASCVFVAALISFGVIWMGAQHLNYALDSSEPVEKKQVIVEKEMDKSGKSTDYYLIVEEQDGQSLEISVSSQDYNTYEIGDTLTYYYYQGAFGEPFYIN